MIEPKLSGQLLLDEIQNTRPEPGQIALWWLGQSGLLIKSRHVVVLVDPYLSEHLTHKYANSSKPHVRMTRCPVSPDCLDFVDVVCGSHKHSDHIDPGTIPALAKASPHAQFVVPEALVIHVESLEVATERIIGLDHDKVFETPDGSVKIRAIKAAHENLDTDAEGRHLYLSFIIQIDGLTLFHSGDTVPFAGQIEAVGGPVDLAFLPINGRNPARNTPGNMNVWDAVGFAQRIKARYVMPHHYDMFTFNTVDVSEFIEAARQLPDNISTLIPQCGERVMVECQNCKQ